MVRPRGAALACARGSSRHEVGNGVSSAEGRDRRDAPPTRAFALQAPQTETLSRATTWRETRRHPVTDLRQILHLIP